MTENASQEAPPQEALPQEAPSQEALPQDVEAFLAEIQAELT